MEHSPTSHEATRHHSAALALLATAAAGGTALAFRRPGHLYWLPAYLLLLALPLSRKLMKEMKKKSATPMKVVQITRSAPS